MSYDDDTNRITRLHDTIKELRAETERLRADKATIYEWMREPDYADVASLEWLTGWVNRRPLGRAMEGK